MQDVDRLNRQIDILSERELKANREAEIAYKAKGKILSLMSHEIRTPMNGVIGMATLLSQTELNSEQADYTNNILDCSKTLLANVNEILVNDMLDFSKVDAENGGLVKKNFNLQNCIEEVLDMFAGKTAESGIDLIYQMDADVPLQISGDYKRLQQILINLAENAVRHTSAGNVFIKVTLVPDAAEDGLKLKFTIRDTGTGISKEQFQNLFKPVLPADYSTKSKEISKGFGLVICERLTKQMGGEISVENNADSGCTFSFTILTDASFRDTPDFVTNEMAGFEGKQILIADDNITTNKVWCSLLEQWKLLPVSAASGKHALEILSQVSIDIVIIDLRMPEMDSIQLSESIRSLYPKMRVVLLHPVNDERYKLHPELINAAMSKPVKHDKLFDTILNEFRHLYSSNNSGLRQIPD
ncbi:MAG: ATP-binding protein, partial [Ginsengibacter sp.]